MQSWTQSTAELLNTCLTEPKFDLLAPVQYWAKFTSNCVLLWASSSKISGEELYCPSKWHIYLSNQSDVLCIFEVLSTLILVTAINVHPINRQVYIATFYVLKKEKKWDNYLQAAEILIVELGTLLRRLPPMVMTQ